MNYTLSAIDVIFGATESISEIDYVSAGRKVINAVVTLAAIIVAVSTYAWTALLLFWDEHGENIKGGAIRVFSLTVDFVDGVRGL